MSGPERALAVNQAFHALGNERFKADGATFIRNREMPGIWDANHVTQVKVSTPETIERLLERVEREYAGFPHRRFDLDFMTPPQFEARLVHEGYQRSDALIMLHEGDLMGSAKRYDIRPVTDEADWQAYADGAARAYCSSWAGPDDMGLVEDLFTHPDFRHRGLATALIHHCAAAARREGAGPVVIVADATDTPKQMYAAMGFRPVAVLSTYRKDIETS